MSSFPDPVDASSAAAAAPADSSGSMMPVEAKLADFGGAADAPTQQAEQAAQAEHHPPTSSTHDSLFDVFDGPAPPTEQPTKLDPFADFYGFDQADRAESASAEFDAFADQHPVPSKANAPASEQLKDEELEPADQPSAHPEPAATEQPTCSTFPDQTAESQAETITSAPAGQTPDESDRSVEQDASAGASKEAPVEASPLADRDATPRVETSPLPAPEQSDTHVNVLSVAQNAETDATAAASALDTTTAMHDDWPQVELDNDSPLTSQEEQSSATYEVQGAVAPDAEQREPHANENPSAAASADEPPATHEDEQEGVQTTESQAAPATNQAPEDLEEATPTTALVENVPAAESSGTHDDELEPGHDATSAAEKEQAESLHEPPDTQPSVGQDDQLSTAEVAEPHGDQVNAHEASTDDQQANVPDTQPKPAPEAETTTALEALASDQPMSPSATTIAPSSEEPQATLDEKALPQEPTPESFAAATEPNEQMSPVLSRHVSSGPEAGRDLPRSTSNGSVTSLSTVGRASVNHLTRGSMVFVVNALETIDKSKEARKSEPLKKASEKALELVRIASASATTSSTNLALGRSESVLEPRTVLEPLRLACATGNTTLVPEAIDCISKLVSFNFFAEEDPFETARHRSHEGRTTPPPAALADLVTDTVCNAFTESADDRTQLQIIKALLSIVLSNTSHVHQGSLLKAIRTVYNIFLLSRNSNNQAVAQASLTQMVHHVFSRIPREQPLDASPTPEEEAEDDKTPTEEVGDKIPATDPSEEAQDKVASEPTKEAEKTPAEVQEDIEDPTPATEEPMTLKTLERRKSFQGASERDTAATLGGISASELFVKDAFLVLRTLCKLSMKPLTADMERDPKSQGMRSKILSLHLVYVILKKHLEVFADPNVVITSTSTGEHTSFIFAVKQYICLSLSRNAVSSVNQIFELAVEIFWLVMDGLRAFLKKEIEVLLNEIFLPILEMKTATPTQKSILLSVLIRLCRTPQALVEVYINYDCDRSALENIYERLINIISRISQTQPGPTLSAPEPLPLAALQRGDEPGLAALAPQHQQVNVPEDKALPVELHLKRQSLECLVAVLHSLVQWASRGTIEEEISTHSTARVSIDSTTVAPTDGGSASPSQHTTNGSLSTLVDKTLQDDPSRFESAKARKNVLIEGIRLFNEKPKRGVAFLVENGFIRSSESKDIAPFLLFADGLNKAQVGEYLGEGDTSNIATMHAFVDLMNFKGMHFLAALRRFLQAFRLPGEAQKIDRFMLKFAERYVMGNPGVFATADTAYVFAYSIIMLNTDAHNPQVKHRMTLQDFIRNNQGIDDGQSLSEDYQRQVYESIVTNEIKMKDEVQAVVPQPAALAGFIAGVGRDQNRAAYELQSEGMANKTESLFRTMVRARRRVGPEQREAVERFFSASHMDHVKPMFEVAWMPILAGISGPMQETSDLDIVQLCLAAFKDAIHISCLFDLELERDAFVTTLAKFTFLNNLAEMKPKHVETIKCLLGIAQVEGNYLKGSWRELLMCVSQLERFQLISGGVDERQLPDLGRRRLTTPSRTSTSGNSLTRTLFSSGTGTDTKPARLPTVDVVQAGASAEVTVAADKVFSQTPQLSGTAIVDFVRALCTVSWEEIQSSGMTDSPRLFSLQKLVEISYYNMGRIRMEWSQIWAILGEHFNNVLVTNQLAVSTFAVDSLRQLAMKFLEKEELPGFAFQKDFLRPFSYAMAHSPEIETREMIIDCLWQMIQARSGNMRSGWASIFLILSAAAQDPSEKVMLQAFELVQGLFESHFEDILLHSFGDFTSCLAAFSQSRAQRVSLQAIGVLRSVIPAAQRLVKASEDESESEAASRLTGPEGQSVYWFAVLTGFYDIVMKGADLEVRRVALDSLFDIATKHGQGFSPEFWDKAIHGTVFKIFGVLHGQNVPSQEDPTVWLSTTMIQALRNLIDLWTAYFSTLQLFFPELLDLLETCICQENDTIARIGTSSLQQLLQNNVRQFSSTQWEQIVDTVMRLFDATTAEQLFDPMLVASSNSAPPAPLVADDEEDAGALPRRLAAGSSSGMQRPLTSSERRKVFKQIIMRCVLQLLLIETVNELLHNPEFYERIPPAQLLRLLRALQDSYSFAKQFNGNKDLRVTLWRLGFMRQLPNLLRQESTAASTLISLLLHMLQDDRPDHLASRHEVLARFVPLGEEITGNFLELDVETQSRNISAWMPVVAEIFAGIAGLNDEQQAPFHRETITESDHTFSYYAPRFFPSAVDLLVKPGLSSEVSLSLRGFFYKAGLISKLCPVAPEPTATVAAAELEGPAALSPVLESNEPSPSPSPLPQLSTESSAVSGVPAQEVRRASEVTLEGQVAQPPQPLAATPNHKVLSEPEPNRYDRSFLSSSTISEHPLGSSGDAQAAHMVPIVDADPEPESEPTPVTVPEDLYATSQTGPESASKLYQDPSHPHASSSDVPIPVENESIQDTTTTTTTPTTTGSEDHQLPQARDQRDDPPAPDSILGRDSEEKEELEELDL